MTVQGFSASHSRLRTSLFGLQATPPASTRQVAFSYDPTRRATTGQVAGQSGFKVTVYSADFSKNGMLLKRNFVLVRADQSQKILTVSIFFETFLVPRFKYEYYSEKETIAELSALNINLAL